MQRSQENNHLLTKYQKQLELIEKATLSYTLEKDILYSAVEMLNVELIKDLIDLTEFNSTLLFDCIFEYIYNNLPDCYQEYEFKEKLEEFSIDLYETFDMSQIKNYIQEKSYERIFPHLLKNQKIKMRKTFEYILRYLLDEDDTIIEAFLIYTKGICQLKPNLNFMIQFYLQHRDYPNPRYTPPKMSEAIYSYLFEDLNDDDILFSKDLIERFINITFNFSDYQRKNPIKTCVLLSKTEMFKTLNTFTSRLNSK